MAKTSRKKLLPEVSEEDQSTFEVAFAKQDGDKIWELGEKNEQNALKAIGYLKELGVDRYYAAFSRLAEEFPVAHAALSAVSDATPQIRYYVVSEIFSYSKHKEDVKKCIPIAMDILIKAGGSKAAKGLGYIFYYNRETLDPIMEAFKKIDNAQSVQEIIRIGELGTEYAEKAIKTLGRMSFNNQVGGGIGYLGRLYSEHSDQAIRALADCDEDRAASEVASLGHYYPDKAHLAIEILRDANYSSNGIKEIGLLGLKYPDEADFAVSAINNIEHGNREEKAEWLRRLSDKYPEVSSNALSAMYRIRSSFNLQAGRSHDEVCIAKVDEIIQGTVQTALLSGNISKMSDSAFAGFSILVPQFQKVMRFPADEIDDQLNEAITMRRRLAAMRLGRDI